MITKIIGSFTGEGGGGYVPGTGLHEGAAGIDCGLAGNMSDVRVEDYRTRLLNKSQSTSNL